METLVVSLVPVRIRIERLTWEPRPSHQWGSGLPRIEAREQDASETESEARGGGGAFRFEAILDRLTVEDPQIYFTCWLVKLLVKLR